MESVSMVQSISMAEGKEEFNEGQDSTVLTWYSLFKLQIQSSLHSTPPSHSDSVDLGGILPLVICGKL